MGNRSDTEQQQLTTWQPCTNGCTTPNRHTTDCTQPCTCTDPGCRHCRGCEPTPTEHGHQVCARCHRRTLTALDELPALYDALLDPSKPGGRQPGPRGTERPLPIRVGEDPEHPGPVEQRKAIGDTLAGLTLTLARDYGITPPRVALHGAILGAVEDRLHAKFAALDSGDRHPAVNPPPPTLTVDEQHEWTTRQRQARAAAEAETTRILRKVLGADQRITRLAGTLDRTDPVHQHARHVAVHLDRLLTRDDAATTVTTLTKHARLAHHLANPSRPDGITIGPCPSCRTPIRVTARLAHEAITCPNCGTSGGIDWWQDAIAGTAHGAATATTAQLAAWLSRRHHTPVSETRIRKWGSPAYASHAGIPALRVGTDKRGRALYDVTETIRYADTVIPTTATQETA